jgi:hypothetical protein
MGCNGCPHDYHLVAVHEWASNWKAVCTDSGALPEPLKGKVTALCTSPCSTTAALLDAVTNAFSKAASVVPAFALELLHLIRTTSSGQGYALFLNPTQREELLSGFKAQFTTVAASQQFVADVVSVLLENLVTLSKQIDACKNVTNHAVLIDLLKYCSGEGSTQPYCKANKKSLFAFYRSGVDIFFQQVHDATVQASTQLASIVLDPQPSHYNDTMLQTVGSTLGLWVGPGNTISTGILPLVTLWIAFTQFEKCQQ